MPGPPAGYTIMRGECGHEPAAGAEGARHGYPLGVLLPFGAMTARSPAYTASKDQLLARLARIEGQVSGVARMVGDDRYCIDVLTQISAVQAALDKVALGLLDGHARHCVLEGEPDALEARTDELMGAVGRLMRRG